MARFWSGDFPVVLKTKLIRECLILVADRTAQGRAGAKLWLTELLILESFSVNVN